MSVLDVEVKSYIAKSKNRNIFSHVYVHEPQDIDLLETRGKLYTTVDITGPDDFIALDYINPFLDDLEDKYFNNDVSGIISVLDNALLSSFHNLSDKIAKNELNGQVNFNIGCFVLWGDIGYMLRIGNSYISLVRDLKIMNLSEHLLSPSGSITSVASGYVKDRDVFVMGTEASSVYLENNIKKVVSLDEKELRDLDMSIDNGDISFIVLSVFSTDKDVDDPLLKEEELKDTNEDFTDAQNDSEIDLGNIENEKKDIDSDVNTLFGNALKQKLFNVSSLIKDNGSKVAMNTYYNSKQKIKDTDFKSHFKSIGRVFSALFQLLFDTISFLKDRRQRQHKIRISRDIKTLNDEKFTLISILVVLFLIIFIFFF